VACVRMCVRMRVSRYDRRKKPLVSFFFSHFFSAGSSRFMHILRYFKSIIRVIYVYTVTGITACNRFLKLYSGRLDS